MVYERNVLVPENKIKTNSQQNASCLENSIYIKKVLNSLDSGLSGNSPHSLGWENAMKLVEITNLRENDICWEIGCGVPILALVLGMVTKTFIIATELSKIFYIICY
jgi:glycerol kinase